MPHDNHKAKNYSKYTKDKERESKNVTIKHHKFSKENSKKERNYKTARKQQDDIDKSLQINNCFKCKYFKISNQNTWMD